MVGRNSGAVRAIALVGPAGSGKTTLGRALAAAAGQTAPDFRGLAPSTELGFLSFDFLGERYMVVDTPGSIEFFAEARCVLPAVDLAIAVADPDPAKALLLQPFLKELERLNTPHALFVNKIDTAAGSVREVLAALQGVSETPLVARQIPIWGADQIEGFVDLALERAYIYRPGGPSEQIAMPSALHERETEARFHMLEQMADFDDALMEQLLSDITPSREEVFADLVRETREGLITPVFFGAAQHGHGLRRLLKALRHDTPEPDAAAARVGATEPGAYVLKVSHAGQAGKLAYARVLAGALSEGIEVALPEGAKSRLGGLMAVEASGARKTSAARCGEIIALAKIDPLHAGELVSSGAPIPKSPADAPRPAPVFQLAIATKDRKDDVRLSVALAKLAEEDRGLDVTYDPETRETLLRGQGEGHLRAVLERLKARFGVDVSAARPTTPYKETIRRALTQRGRHKKQTGGHGQFGDVLIEVKPLPLGQGFQFIERITGGAVPRQWIPAVEQGVRDAMEKGPLGFPVVDVAVTLIDGSFHTVDSSELAFRSAGRIAMSEALQAAEPYLLEPIEKLEIYSPAGATSKINSAVSSRHGQILGFSGRKGWNGWDQIDVYLPHAERQDFILELRSITQGLGTFESRFDHMVEISGRRGEDVMRKRGGEMHAGGH